MRQSFGRGLAFIGALAFISCCCAPIAFADGSIQKKMYDAAKPSLVAVKYTWENELESRELVAAGIIVGDDGLVMFPIGIVHPAVVPDSQMKDFKIILPSDTEDETEIDAVFQGRDERTNMAFVRAKEPQKWKSITFVDSVPEIGDAVYSVGILPKASGYKAFVNTATVAATLRGPIPQILVDGALAGVGAPVFNSAGEGIGYVPMQGLLGPVLDNPDAPEDIPMVYNSAKTFIPSSDFLLSLKDPPTPDHPAEIPWFGCVQLKGLDKEFAEFVGLKNVPAVQIGDVVAGAPADRAGLKPLDIIIKMNGQPLERGDLPVELPEILSRQISRMNVGDKVTFTIIHQKGDIPRDVTVTLEPRPTQPHSAHRYYAKDMGFVVRDVVFADTYRRKLSPDTGGVVVALLRPQAAAQAAHLGNGDLVTEMNGKPVTDLDEFKKDYQDFRKTTPRDPVVLVVSRPDGKEQTINIEPPQDDAVPGGAGGGY
jgi:serine protease Do